jgi:hypothetical protein
MKEKEEIWILKGYETFALFGEKGLKVEQIQTNQITRTL